jgi:polyisoprenyl-teichoic acid--peptidoglycan teichoic acid transferase
MGLRDPQHVRRRNHIDLPPWGTYALMALFVLIIVGLGYFTFNAVKDFVAGLPGAAEDGGPQSDTSGGSTEGEAQGSSSAPDPDVWKGGRVTILILGIDERQSEQGPWRTDTMILLTMDPATKTAGMLSLPRDLWVEIPDYNGVYDRINTAHFRGDADQYPGGGGAALAMKTVQYNFGVPVEYYASINFYAFVQIIDRLGCIPIHVSETIDDPDYPAAEGSGYDPFYIEAGEYCMGGETLLKYARTRATFGSDFDRATRQQQVIMAIRDKVLDSGELPNLLAQAQPIYTDVQSGVKTNLSLEQMVSLAQLASEIPEENICRGVISGEYVEDLVTREDNSQVIIWNREKVRVLISDLFTASGQCAPGGAGQPQNEDTAAAAKAENARINILNGTNQEGLATETSNRLTTSGLSVLAVGNADRFDYEQTIIYNYTGKDATAKYIALILGLPETAIRTVEPTSALYDIEIVLGADYLD